MIDDCSECRTGRALFVEVITSIKMGLILTCKGSRLIQEFNRMIEKPSNCGSPDCPNLRKTNEENTVINVTRVTHYFSPR